jgi:hypothetical protein
MVEKLEAGVGIEPAYTDLQAALDLAPQSLAGFATPSCLRRPLNACARIVRLAQPPWPPRRRQRSARTSRQSRSAKHARIDECQAPQCCAIVLKLPRPSSSRMLFGPSPRRCRASATQAPATSAKVMPFLPVVTSETVQRSPDLLRVATGFRN